MPNALMHWVKDAQAEGQEIDKALEQLKALLEGLTVVTPIGPKVVDLIDLVRARAQSIEFQMNGLASVLFNQSLNENQERFLRETGPGPGRE